MSKNEPVHDTPSPRRISFFYNWQNKQPLAANLSVEQFFGLPPGTNDLTLLMENPAIPELSSYWRSLHTLEENQTKTFSFIPGNKPQWHFFIDAIKPPVSILADESIVLINAVRIDHSVSPNSQEFAEFVELACHDLDSPLRKLMLFSERLFSKLEKEHDEDSRNYLQRMQSLIAVMRKMIDDLSILSDLKIRTMNLETVDTKNLVHHSVVETGLEEDQVKILGEPPAIQGDESQYKLLFYHLFENAVKFSKKDVKPEVSVAFEKLTGADKVKHDLPEHAIFHRIVVSDNGIGLDQASAKKIFVPFVRLNGKSEYPGNGIGLAICKKIVENHRGIIYAEGIEEIGTSFTLILPQSPTLK